MSNELYIQTSRLPLSRNKRSKCLIIYTGGTIGMTRTKDGTLAPASGYLQSTLQSMPELAHEDVPEFDVMEWEEPMDSSDFSPACWIRLATQIEENYFSYDGFVILHGTDTMAYTASALSFMCENLAKTVILTGAMIPLFLPVSDGKRNLIISLMCSVNLDVPEVCIFFNNTLLRGNRCRKIDPGSVAAFDSPNYPPLAVMGVHIQLQRELVLPAPKKRFFVHTNLYSAVTCMVLSPGFDDAAILAYIKSSNNHQPVALILQLYGSGNAPAHKQSFLSALKEACEVGVVVITSQCLRGSVDMTAYRTGNILLQYGVIDGRDMTIEACVTKLAVMMGMGLRGERLKSMMEGNIRGELTLKSRQEYNVNEHVLVPSYLLASNNKRKNNQDRTGINNLGTKAIAPISSIIPASIANNTLGTNIKSML